MYEYEEFEYEESPESSPPSSPTPIVKAKPAPKPYHPLVFLGDSFIHHWLDEGKQLWDSLYAPLGAINYGFLNESTQDIVDRIVKDQLPALETAKSVVLMVGNTDLRCRLKERIIFEQIRYIVQLCQERRSGVKIVILGVLPHPDYPSLREAMQYANELLSSCENGFTIRFLDMEDKFLDMETGKTFDALYSDDKSKLSEEGYNVWATSMAKVFKEIL